jgi:hypothetical protein
MSDKSEYEQLINQHLAIILQNAGPELALRVRHAIDNGDIEELERINRWLEEWNRKSRALIADTDRLLADTARLLADKGTTKNRVK